MLNDIATFMSQFKYEVLILEFGAFDGFNETLHANAQVHLAISAVLKWTYKFFVATDFKQLGSVDVATKPRFWHL